MGSESSAIGSSVVIAPLRALHFAPLLAPSDRLFHDHRHRAVDSITQVRQERNS